MGFGVFDGHGGMEVAQYTGQKLPEMLSKAVKAKLAEIEQAKGDEKALKLLLASILHQTIMELDSKIVDPKVAKELRKIVDLANSDAGSDVHEDRTQEIKDLCEEAELSIEELRAKYGAPTGN